MRDRLGEMKYGYMSEEEDRFQMGPVGVDPFLSEVEELKGLINKIADDLMYTKRIHSELSTQLSSPDSKRRELDSLRKNVSTTSMRVNTGIERLKGRMTSKAGQTAGHQTRKTQMTALVNKFNSLMEAYNEEQELFKKKSKDKFSRLLKINGVDKSDQDIQDMIESDDPNVFSNDPLVHKVRSRDSLNEIEQFYHDILDVEKDIWGFQEIFRDLAILIDEQDDNIDNIEARF